MKSGCIVRKVAGCIFDIVFSCYVVSSYRSVFFKSAQPVTELHTQDPNQRSPHIGICVSAENICDSKTPHTKAYM